MVLVFESVHKILKCANLRQEVLLLMINVGPFFDAIAEILKRDHSNDRLLALSVTVDQFLLICLFYFMKTLLFLLSLLTSCFCSILMV